MTFARDPSTLRLTGLRASQPQALAEAWSDLTARGEVVAADVSLGAWRSHQIAAEMFAQLGLAAPSALLSAPGAARADVASTAVARRIDLETAGDRAALDAHRLVCALVPALTDRAPIQFVVVMSCHGAPWEPCDAFFVRFLAQALRTTRHQLVLVCWGTGAPALPADWDPAWTEVRSSEPVDAAPASLLALVPGIVTPEVGDALIPAGGRASLIPLSGGCALVSPAVRRDPRGVPAELHDQLAIAGAGIPWLVAYAACNGSDDVVAPSFLWEYARQISDAGSRVAVLRLTERGIARARSPIQRSVFQLLAQSALIASGRFAEATALPEPDPGLDPELQGWLWHARGWALTMAGQLAPGAASLARARALLGARPDRDEYLYVLNISALNLLKSGDWDGAVALEQQIRATLQQVGAGSAQITYINSLNLARLYLRRGDHATAEQLYREAFATSAGVRSDSDAIYAQVCMAKLCETRGLHAEASSAWARAAMFWMSSAVPEAVGPRVIGAILGPAGGPAGGPTRGPAVARFDAVCAALLEHIVRADPAGAPRAQDGSPRAEVCLLRAELLGGAAAASGPWHALRGHGAWLLATPRALGTAYGSTVSRALAALLLDHLAPPDAAGDRAWTLVVDDRLGTALPGTEAELLASCLRLGIDAVTLADRPISLSAPRRAALERRLGVRLGPAVARIAADPDGDLAVFKRYRPPRRLSNAARRVVRQLEAGARSVGELAAALAGTEADPVMPLVRALERDRIVEIVPPPEAAP